MSMRQWGAALFLLWVILLGLGVRRVRASIVLDRFDAFPGDAQVLLEWETTAEVDNTGFYVNRSLQETGGYVRIGAFIPAQGGAGGGAYTYVDTAVVNGLTYYYWLEAVDTGGTSQFEGPVQALPGAATGTPSPTTTASATSTATPTGSVTVSATATTVRTATSTRTITPTPGPSSTPTLSPTPSDTPTVTPLPTFMPTRTPTATFFPTRTPTATASATLGPLLEATLSPGTPVGRLADLAEQAGLTLGESILLTIVLIALLGGVVFVGLAYLFLQRRPG